MNLATLSVFTYVTRVGQGFCHAAVDARELQLPRHRVVPSERASSGEPFRGAGDGLLARSVRPIPRTFEVHRQVGDSRQFHFYTTLTPSLENDVVLCLQLLSIISTIRSQFYSA